MDASVVQQKLIERYLADIAQSEYPSITVMDRVEKLISDEEELETYAAVLMQKVEEQSQLSPDILDRVERILILLQQREEKDGRVRS